MTTVARSVHVGVNRGWWSTDHGLAVLEAAEDDANAMANLAKELGIADSTLLVGPDARVNAVSTAIHSAIEAVGDDGFLLITYAGHGLDLTGGGVLDEDVDQSFVLYDGLLCDDCFAEILSSAPAGVRVVCIFDSCTAAELVTLLALPPTTSVVRSLSWRDLPEEQQEKLKSSCDACTVEPVRAQTIVLAACARFAEAHEEGGHGEFTRALLEIWVDGGFEGTYEELIGAAADLMPDQTPVLRTLGSGAQLPQSRAFELTSPG
jgi:metacaspase-1